MPPSPRQAIAEILGIRVGDLFKDPARTGAVPVALVTDSAAARMMTAYADITDRSVRRNLSELVEQIAKSAKKESG